MGEPAGAAEVSERKSFEFVVQKSLSFKARYCYGCIFLLANLFAWTVRDYGHTFTPFQYLRSCGIKGGECFQTLGVLRISLGCFIFFFAMFITSCYTTKLYEARNTWHSRWWLLKFILFLLCLVIPFFIPPDIVHIYGELALVGAGVFLILQLISIIEFISWCNHYWMPHNRTKQSFRQFLGILMSTILYIASLCGVGLIYWRYSPSLSCGLNIVFITLSVIVLVMMMAISLQLKDNRGLLSSGIMASYIVFLCWSAITSEPAIHKCGSLKQTGHGDWTTVPGFLIAIGAIVVATFSTGIDSEAFQLRKVEEKQPDDIPYNYGFFHLIFSLGAMYFAMLFISWDLQSSTRKWSIDVGWASTWIKIASLCFAATIFMWKLIYSASKESKVAPVEDLVQHQYNTECP